MIIKRIYISVFLLILVSSCGSQKRIVTKRSKKKDHPIPTKVETKNDEVAIKVVVNPEPKPEKTAKTSTEQYITDYSGIAKEEMVQYGIPASITLAQGILESASGNGRLAVKANNHFGIKCHDWNGAKIYHDDDRKGECFRKYKNAKYSFQDHSVFLSSRKRYHKLFILDKADYKGWAKGLKAAGYATDKKYPQKLIDLIERYQLYRFDAEVMGKAPKANNKHVVLGGDTLYSLSKKYDISIEELKRLNGLDSNDLFVGQVLLVKPMPKGF